MRPSPAEELLEALKVEQIRLQAAKRELQEVAASLRVAQVYTRQQDGTIVVLQMVSVQQSGDGLIVEVRGVTFSG